MPAYVLSRQLLRGTILRNSKKGCNLHVSLQTHYKCSLDKEPRKTQKYATMQIP